jgi:hypothetical protein
VRSNWTVAKAISWNKAYTPSEEEVFTCGVIYLFISLSFFKVGNVKQSWASFNRSAEIISRKEPKVLIPEIFTYLMILLVESCGHWQGGNFWDYSFRNRLSL